MAISSNAKWLLIGTPCFTAGLVLSGHAEMGWGILLALYLFMLMALWAAFDTLDELSRKGRRP